MTTKIENIIKNFIKRYVSIGIIMFLTGIFMVIALSINEGIVFVFVGILLIIVTTCFASIGYFILWMKRNNSYISEKP